METGDRTGSHFASEPRAPRAVAQIRRRDPGQAGTASTGPASRAAPSNIIGTHKKEIELLNRAILLLMSAVAVAACGSDISVAPVPSARPAVSPDTKGGSVDPHQTPTPHSTVQPYPSGSPAPGDGAHAAALVERYERALVDGDWTTAYGMLAAGQRSLIDFRDFRNERSAFMQSVAGRFSLERVIHDRQTIETWTADAVSTRDADLASAFVITVDYPAIAADTNANFDVFLVAPDRNAAWWIWPLR